MVESETMTCEPRLHAVSAITVKATDLIMKRAIIRARRLPAPVSPIPATQRLYTAKRGLPRQSTKYLARHRRAGVLGAHELVGEGTAPAFLIRRLWETPPAFLVRRLSRFVYASHAVSTKPERSAYRVPQGGSVRSVKAVERSPTV